MKEYVTRVRLFIRTIAKEVWANVHSYYEDNIRTILHYVDKIREIAQERCENSVDCKSLVRSYQTDGWKGLLTELRNILLSLPGKNISVLIKDNLFFSQNNGYIFTLIIYQNTEIFS